MPTLYRNDSHASAPVRPLPNAKHVTAHLVSVLPPVAVDRPYTYASDRPLVPGTVVAAPLGPRTTMGIVWPDEPDSLASERIKSIEQLFDIPPLPLTLLRFVDWVADYTLAPLGMVLRMVLRSSGALAPERAIPGVRFVGRSPERMTAARLRVLDLVDDGLAWSKSGLATAAGVSPGV